MKTNTRLLKLLVFLGLSACGGGDGTPPTGGTNPKNHAPVANASADVSVDEGLPVELNATASTDADGDALTFAWTQTGGSPVTLTNANKAKATFTAPFVAGGALLTFEVAVSDGTATDKDSVKITVNDETAPTGEMQPTGKILGKSEAIIVTFDEAMDPASLELDGTLAAEVDFAWTEGNKVLTLSPSAVDDAWISGSDRTIEISAADAAGNATPEVLRGDWLVKLVFENFQAADVVIGQPGMTSNAAGASMAEMSGTPYGSATVHQGRLYVSDSAGNRILGFNTLPAMNGATADFQIGTGTGTTSQTTHWNPQSLSASGENFVVTDFSNGRVAVYNPLPTSDQNSGPGSIKLVVGQPDFDTAMPACNRTTTNSPESSFITPDGKLLLVDSYNHRVLVWNAIPASSGAPADLVLGQTVFDSCNANDADADGIYAIDASGLDQPTGVWSDGEKLVILDSNNNRILIWNSFPTVSGQAANLVLGQPDFDSVSWNAVAENTMNYPFIGVASNGEQLFVVDYGFNRVLIWNSWPTQDQQPADGVLGQANLSLRAPNNDDMDDGTWGGTPTARVLSSPIGIALYGDQLIVTDNSNLRYLIYNSR